MLSNGSQMMVGPSPTNLCFPAKHSYNPQCFILKVAKTTNAKHQTCHLRLQGNIIEVKQVSESRKNFPFHVNTLDYIHGKSDSSSIYL